jgi:hypothetical protein
VYADNELSFSSDIAPVFKEAGFVMDSTGRRLLADNSISGQWRST